MEYNKFLYKLLNFVNDNNTWAGKWDLAGLSRSDKFFLTLKEFSIKNWNSGNEKPIKEEGYFSNLNTMQLMNEIFKAYSLDPKIKKFFDKEFSIIN